MDAGTLREVATQVSRYFRDFLESDFKRQQAPRRRIVLQSETGFRSGMRVLPYPALHRELWNLLSRPSGEELTFSMTPRRFTRPVSPVLLKIIQEQIGAIPETALETTRNAVFDRAWATYSRAVQHPEEWVEGIRATLAEHVGAQIVRPLIAHLDGPLKQQAYSVIDSLYAAESELIARVAAPLDAALPEVLARLLATQDPAPISDALVSFLTLQGAREALMAFFERFVAADAYLEFRDLDTYVSTGEGLQLYLYIGALKYRNVHFPLFFVPLEATRTEGGGYSVKLQTHLFANRRAMDFVVQEIAAGLQRTWLSPVQERITYLEPQQSIYEVARTLFGHVAHALDLAGQIELSSTAPDASTSHVTLSSALHIVAFERSDEALINDFEEIIDQARRGGSAIVDLFQNLVQGVLVDNPVSIAPAIEAEWDGLPMVDRVVADSPVPLNEEQRKILLATRSPQGRIVVVEGPPGTGKSHTITALAADCAFHGRSCLVLSDKNEALEVVQRKLADVMNAVRPDTSFPNPILRLGQQHANFRHLTSNQTVSQITNFARAMKANRPRLEEERRQTSFDLRQAIARSVKALGSVSLAELHALHADEAALAQRLPGAEALVLSVKDARFIPELEGAESQAQVLEDFLSALFAEGDFTPASLGRRLSRDQVLLAFVQERRGALGWEMFDRLDVGACQEISRVLLAFRQLRHPLFGYLFKKARINQLEVELQRLGPTRPIQLRQDAPALDLLLSGATALRLKLEAADHPTAFPEAYARLARGLVPHPATAAVHGIVALLQRLGPTVLETLLAQPKDDATAWPLLIRVLRRSLQIRQAFASAPQYDYVGSKTVLERLNTSVMTSHVDTRLVDFMQNHRSDAKALAAVISQRQKFPEDKFQHVRDSFPVMIASIREFGEFAPLVSDLFDVVIIDEASQVSVAQALPAVLRAKKLVVLGDSKQFSNVKSSNASIELNEKYRAELVQYFERNVTRDAAALARLAMFDVKRSILEFCSLGASYTVMLRKHFRSFAELIGYSSATFYGHQLQAIKIRTVPLDEVVRFDQVDASQCAPTRGTNRAEADFILARLLELVDEEHPPTVGVVTPFREQQTLLTRVLFEHPRARDFEERLRLRTWTFDTVQGEERHIIFYSLVATPGQDALNYIFPVSLQDAEQSVEHKLKVQRLNVGFSRAQSMVWFVHSMPLDQYRGAFGQALAYYANVLQRRDVRPEETDPASPMEARVLHWLQQTPFVQANQDCVEILPQFPVGEYLRQLDPTYRHPAWRVDFLLTYESERGPVHIVIEYDGFEFHFQPGAAVHPGNHERYLVEADVERQLTLESYGYRFLRINRFNLGTDPVATLSERLFRLVDVAGGKPVSGAVARVQRDAAALANKDKKPCSRCHAIKPIEDFFDPTLQGGAGGHGRVCMACKGPKADTTLFPGQNRRRKRRRRW